MYRHVPATSDASRTYTGADTSLKRLCFQFEREFIRSELAPGADTQL